MMKDYTDMDMCKKIAHLFLQMEPEADNRFSFLVYHPFTKYSVVEGRDGTIGNILQNQDDLKYFRERMGSCIDNAQSYFDFIALLNDSYYLEFLRHTENFVSDASLSRFLAYAWIKMEFPNLGPVSKSEIANLFKRAIPQLMMDEHEMGIYNSLDDIVTIYRGITINDKKYIRGMSWTLNEEVAEKFAERFEIGGAVYKARISKKDIFAFFDGRNEQEIVVDSSKLRQIQLYKNFNKERKRASVEHSM